MKMDKNIYHTKFGLKMFICNDIIEKGLMMWVSFAMDGNKQEGKWLVIKCKALKWVNGNSALPKGSS